MDLDAVVHKCLDQSKNGRLKSPRMPKDYLALFSLIVENTPYYAKYHNVEHHVSIVKKKYWIRVLRAPSGRTSQECLTCVLREEDFELFV